MRQVLPPLAVAATFLLAASASAFAAEPVTFVPWKVLKDGDAPLRASFVLVWIPASGDDFKRSELQVSRTLALLKSQCVGLQVIRSDDWLMIEKLDARGKLPMALMVAGADWQIVAKTDNDHGALRVGDVETMVRDVLGKHEEWLVKQLDVAQERLDGGDRQNAVALYSLIAKERCAFPRCAREASRALKKLGVVEDDD
jgi:hypothetical protein